MEHPFHPNSIHFDSNIHVPFENCTLKGPEILGIFSMGVGAIMLASIFYYGWNRARCLLFTWLVTTSLIHFFFEGYFVLFGNPKKSAGFFGGLATSHSLFAQMWKEYSLADSRYIVFDPVTVVIEFFAAFVEGPLCMLAAYWLNKGDMRWRLVALIASIGQWFGVVIYYLEAFAQDFKYTRPEPFYFWAYFIGMNLPWFVIPMILMKENISYILNLLKKQPQQQKIKST